MNQIKSAQYTIQISSELRQKLEWLCKEINNTEWCGYLVYKVLSGSIENKDLVLLGTDFILMDIGSSAYTEFESGNVFSEYLIDNDLFDGNTFFGILHSHHQMAAFFSGTDMSTLEEFAKVYTHFVSLIVNNDGNWVAAITQQEKNKVTTTIEPTVTTFNGVTFKGDKTTKEEENTTYSYFGLNIEKADITTNINPEEIYKDRIEELRKAPIVTNRITEFGNLFTNSIYTKSKNKYLEDNRVYPRYTGLTHNSNNHYSSRVKANTYNNIRNLLKSPSKEAERLVYRLITLNMGYFPNTMISLKIYTQLDMVKTLDAIYNGNLVTYASHLEYILEMALMDDLWNTNLLYEALDIVSDLLKSNTKNIYLEEIEATLEGYLCNIEEEQKEEEKRITEEYEEEGKIPYETPKATLIEDKYKDSNPWESSLDDMDYNPFEDWDNPYDYDRISYYNKFRNDF